MIGTSVASIFCTMNRSRSTISGLPSSAASVESHMFAWYAEDVPPEKYMADGRPVVGEPRVEPVQHLLLARRARFLGSSQVREVDGADDAEQPRDDAEADAAAAGVVGGRRDQQARRGRARRRPAAGGRGGAARMRGGAAVRRSAEASMFRVTIGSVRVRRTRTATAWQAKCSA